LGNIKRTNEGRYTKQSRGKIDRHTNIAFMEGQRRMALL
jgi:hypothetical protein